jgi:hypothetical protein
MGTIYIVVFSHRHGIDAWPVFQSEKPIEGDIITDLRSGGVWDESDDENSSIDIRGPFSKDKPRG